MKGLREIVEDLICAGKDRVKSSLNMDVWKDDIDQAITEIGKLVPEKKKTGEEENGNCLGCGYWVVDCVCDGFNDAIDQTRKNFGLDISEKC